MSWVGRKRAPLLGAGTDWVEAVRRYSALGRSNTRARWVRALPWAYVPERSAGWNAQWLELRALVLELEAGIHPDPCPTAMHWGGRTDPRKVWMVNAPCALPTVNTFYAVRRR